MSGDGGAADDRRLERADRGRRFGVALLRGRGLISSTRSGGNQRRYARETIRRVWFIRVAQQVGLTLDEIRAALGSLPDNRTPTKQDWERLARDWRPRVDQQIAVLERLRDRLTGCIGCGCLSLEICQLYNPGDELAERAPGPHHIVDDLPG